MSEEAYLYFGVRDAKTGRILKNEIKKYDDALEALLELEAIKLRIRGENEYDTRN